MYSKSYYKTKYIKKQKKEISTSIVRYTSTTHQSTPIETTFAMERK